MNDSNENVSSHYVVVGTANGVSVLVCTFAAALVFVLKLHRHLVYRLALYQVLSSLALASVAILQITLVNHDRNPRIYERVCTAAGWFTVYTEWMKLLFTMWVTLHLFCFAVLHRNLKKLEVLYIVTSLLVPALVAAVPLVTGSYGPSLGSTYMCKIYAQNEIASIESIALWDAPALVALLVSSTAMGVVVAKLARKVCNRVQYEPLTEGDSFLWALKHLLPLAAFPILFFVFEIPLLTFHIYMSQHIKPNSSLDISRLVFFSLWSMTSGLTLIIHILVAQVHSRKKKKISSQSSNENRTLKQQNRSLYYHATRFSPPSASV